MSIRQDTQKENIFSIPANIITQKQLLFNPIPNVFQIKNNSLTDTLYVGLDNTLSSTRFSLSVMPGAVGVLTYPKGTVQLYFFIVTPCSVEVTTFRDDNIQVGDLNKTAQVEIINTSLGEVVSIGSALPVGNNNIGKVSIADTPYVSSCNIQNISLTDADTEYSISIPNGTKKFNISLQDFDSTCALSIAYLSSATNVIKAPGDIGYYIDGLNSNNMTVYVKASIAGKVLQLEAWS